jgi:hypothetical protein
MNEVQALNVYAKVVPQLEALRKLNADKPWTQKDRPKAAPADSRLSLADLNFSY